MTLSQTLDFGVPRLEGLEPLFNREGDDFCELDQHLCSKLRGGPLDS